LLPDQCQTSARSVPDFSGKKIWHNLRNHPIGFNLVLK
jgi:hypothetical protein